MRLLWEVTEVKNKTWILVCVLLLFALSGCGAGHDAIMRRAVSYAEENRELLQACAQELQALLCEEAGDSARTSVLSYKIERQDASKLRLYNYAEEREESFENARCEEVLRGGLVQSISVHAANGICSVAFSCGGQGVGSNTAYYDIQIIPSDNAEDLWGFDSKMTFAERAPGFLGRAAEGDNSFFYYRIAEGVYYTEAFY